jgi:acyl carrier protein
MKTREEIIAQVNSLLAEEFEIEESEFAPDANLKETLNLDSINLVDLIALVQFTYKITIPVEDLKKIQTFNNLYDYIEQHLPA